MPEEMEEMVLEIQEVPELVQAVAVAVAQEQPLQKVMME